MQIFDRVFFEKIRRTFSQLSSIDLVLSTNKRLLKHAITDLFICFSVPGWYQISFLPAVQQFWKCKTVIFSFSVKYVEIASKNVSSPVAELHAS